MFEIIERDLEDILKEKLKVAILQLKILIL